MNTIVKYQAENGNDITLSLDTVRRYVSGNDNVTEQEFMNFAALCKAHKLDPFIRECYLIKYGNQPAQMQVGKDAYLKRAARNERFAGYDAGVTVVKSDGQIERRRGSMVGSKTERLVGGWCEVYVKGYQTPMYDEVALDEYAARKRDGSFNAMWASKPATMIRKVAISHALREAFPESLGGLYTAEEFGESEQQLEPIEVPAHEVSEPAQTVAAEPPAQPAPVEGGGQTESAQGFEAQPVTVAEFEQVQGFEQGEI